MGREASASAAAGSPELKVFTEEELAQSASPEAPEEGSEGGTAGEGGGRDEASARAQSPDPGAPEEGSEGEAAEEQEESEEAAARAETESPELTIFTEEDLIRSIRDLNEILDSPTPGESSDESDAPSTEPEADLPEAHLPAAFSPESDSTAESPSPSPDPPSEDPYITEQLEYWANQDAQVDEKYAEPQQWEEPAPEYRPWRPLNFVFVSAEVAPWSKTGGLGDVVGALPRALAARGHRVMVVTPRYLNGTKQDELFANNNLGVNTGLNPTGVRVGIQVAPGPKHDVTYYHRKREGVDYLFVSHPCFKRPGGLYDHNGREHDDNHWRFALLSLAALEAPLRVPLDPPGEETQVGRAVFRQVFGDDCVFVANDWHAGLVPLYLAARYRPNGVFQNARALVTIHNLAYQGVLPASKFGDLGLDQGWYGRLKHREGGQERINVLRGALTTADRIVTVSQGYASETLTRKFGCGLEGVLHQREDDFNGIVNGIDEAEWDPATDEHLAGPKAEKLGFATYHAGDLTGKMECKLALQAQLGLQVHPDVPLVGWIGRLSEQKGPDIVLESVPEIVGRGCQLVMLGSGDPGMEKWVAEQGAKYGERGFKGIAKFDVGMAHRIMAACDVMLMPSRFEPCGLNQLYAMRYGTVPVVTSTGGLRDTVTDFSPFGGSEGGGSAGTGFTFVACTAAGMMAALDSALELMTSNPEEWHALRVRCMLSDWSWARSAEQYETVAEWMLGAEAIIGSERDAFQEAKAR